VQVAVANALMWVALDWLGRPLDWWLSVGAGDRVVFLGLSVAAGALVYFAVLLVLGLRPSKLGIRPH
jgi:peptidoglycan biosynthesis protein MviN/MurJ (putative lipid II flippase)